MNYSSKILDLKVAAITPVHVGTGSEKDWLRGLDVVWHENQLKKVNLQFWTQLDNRRQQQLTTYIEKGKFEDLEKLLLGIGNQHPNTFSDSFPFPFNSIEPIKTQIKTGGGKPFLPGSSLKGALGSVFIHHLLKGKTISDSQDLKKQGLDELDESMMSLLQIGDIHFDKTGIINTKIFNLVKDNNEWSGGWKHEFTRSSRKFEPYGFTGPLQAIFPGSVGDLRIKMVYLGKRHKDLTNSTFYKDLYDSNPDHQKFFQLINKHTQDYLNKEIAFFKRYENEQTDYIISCLEDLLKETKKEDTALLRVGFGSGFHSMTGDWKFEDHLRTIEHPVKNQQYKSRRLGFYKDEEHYQFRPLGFLKIFTREAFEKAKPDFSNWEITYPQTDSGETKDAAPEPKEPVMRKAADLKDESEVDAIVLKQQGKQIIVKVFIEEYHNGEFKIRYPIGFPKDTLLTVKMNFQGKNIKQGFNLINPKEK